MPPPIPPAVRLGSFARRPLRQGNPLYTVTFRATNMLQLTDKITGAFLGGGFTRALAEVHDEAAYVTRLGMVEELKKKVRNTGRRQRGTKYLEISLIDDRNSVVTATGFNTLLPQWMNRSPAAKYWRRIELGDQTTFNSYILFTNDFNNYYGPWSPGGARGEDVRRNSRNRARGGSGTAMSPRKQPPGYKHMRMPQHRGALVFNIGPYPAYEYSEGGRKALARYRMAPAYKDRLARIGISFESQRR